MMVLCEETSIASLVNEHFQHIVNAYNVPYNSKKVMEIHTDLNEEELGKARLRLDKIDDNDDALQVFISVLMLREGFDRKNIAMIVVPRLLKQICCSNKLSEEAQGLCFQKQRMSRSGKQRLKRSKTSPITNHIKLL
jgi:hypothetical protein